jgi:hypothetical protein
MNSLFIRDPVLLDGYIPKFTKQETLLNYRVKEVTIGGGLGSMEDPTFENRMCITIEGEEIMIDERYFYGYSSIYHDILKAVNLCISKSSTSKKVTDWINKNYDDLVNSAGYWHAIDFQERIKKEEANIAELQENVRLRKIWANVLNVQVLLTRRFNESDRLRTAVEFGMTEEEYRIFTGQ